VKRSREQDEIAREANDLFPDAECLVESIHADGSFKGSTVLEDSGAAICEIVASTRVFETVARLHG
jgi:hypothetical protein